MDFKNLGRALSVALAPHGLRCLPQGHVLGIYAAKIPVLELVPSFPGAAGVRIFPGAGAMVVTALSVLRALGVELHDDETYEFRVENGALYASLRITTACNFRCGFCFVDLDGKFVPVPAAMRMLGLAAAAFGLPLRGARVLLTGGEPLLHPGYAELAARLDKEGCRTQTLTNASLLAMPGAARRIFGVAPPAGRSAFVSLHSHIPTSFAAVTHAGASYGVTIAGIANLLSETEIRVTINRVFCAANKGEFRAYAEFLRDHILPNRPGGFELALSVVGTLGGEGGASLVRFSGVADEIAAALPILRTLPVTLLNLPTRGGGADLPYCFSERIAPEFRTDPKAHRVVPKDIAGRRPRACESCIRLPHCAGVLPEYLDRFGEGEFEAITA